MGTPEGFQAVPRAALIAVAMAIVRSRRVARRLGEQRLSGAEQPRASTHRPPGSILHRWRPFPEHHLTVIEGIVSTRVPRTLVDLAGVIHPGRTERAVDNCLAAGVVTFHTLQEAFTDLAGQGRKGIAVMRDIIEARGPLYVASESELEDRFLQLISSAGLPAPVRQHHVGDGAGWIGRADFAGATTAPCSTRRPTPGVTPSYAPPAGGRSCASASTTSSGGPTASSIGCVACGPMPPDNGKRSTIS